MRLRRRRLACPRLVDTAEADAAEERKLYRIILYRNENAESVALVLDRLSTIQERNLLA